MARIRSVKPEFWSDRKLTRVSRDARLLYVALWNLADEHARLLGDVRYIKGQCLPYDDDLGPVEVEGLIKELEALGRVVRYDFDDEPYLFLPKLAQHQRLEPGKVPSRLPAPPDPLPASVDLGEIGTDPRPSESRADSSAPRADESSLLYVAGSREHVAGSSSSAPASQGADGKKRGTRIPHDFTVTAEMIAWAAEECPGVDGLRETEKFVDYWRGKSGQAATKVDWVSTWRNWMRNAADRGSSPVGARASPGEVKSRRQQETDAMFERAMARAQARDAAEEEGRP